MFVIVNQDFFFDIPAVRSVELMEGHVLSVIPDEYSYSSKAGRISMTRYTAEIEMPDGFKFNRVFYDTETRGHPPLVDELIQFKKALFDNDTTAYVLDREKWNSRFMTGSKMFQRTD